MKSLFWRSVTSIIAFSVLGLPAICVGQGLNGKANVSPDLAAMIVANAANPNAICNVIVQFALPPTADELRRINSVAAGHAPMQSADLSAVQGQLYSLPVQALNGVVNDPNVAYVSLDRTVQPTLDISNVTVGAQTAFSAGLTGAGVGVAIIDSGILLPQTDLLSTTVKSASRVVYSQSFVPNLTGTSDQYGHGTHVAGIVAGNGTNSTGSSYFKTFRGIAPGEYKIFSWEEVEDGAWEDPDFLKLFEQKGVPVRA